MTNNSVNSLRGIPSAILTENQQQALLELLKEMSSIFWGPDQKKCVALLKESFFDPFEKINALPGLQMSKALTAIGSILKKFAHADALNLHLEEAYVRLFISDRKGITTPLYESCYTNIKSGEKALLMGQPAVDMKKRYRSKGLSVSKEIHEPPDHLSIELEYLYFLLGKGWSDGDEDLIVCLQKVLDRSGIKIREGFRFPNIFSRSIKQPLKCNYTSYAEALYFS